MPFNRYNVPFLVVGVVVAVVVAYVFAPGRAHVILRNESGVVATSATVTVDDDARSFTDIAPGEERHAAFWIQADSTYVVAVKLASGRALQAAGGYLTNGIRSDDVITISPDRVTVQMNYR